MNTIFDEGKTSKYVNKDGNYDEMRTRVLANYDCDLGVLVIDLFAGTGQYFVGTSSELEKLPGFEKSKRILESMSLNKAVRKVIEEADIWHNKNHELYKKVGYTIREI
jgi:16S rRNA G966 N2-methylase RsmD